MTVSHQFPIWLLAAVLIAAGGCRAISRFGESRQSIAARRLSRAGLKAMHEGRWDTAESLFSDALDVSGSDDRAHAGLAESLWQRGQHEAAVGHMERAVRLSAGDPKRLLRLGRMYLELGRLEDARDQCRAALEANRNAADVWTLHGDCLRASGNDVEALAAYHRALALRPDSPKAHLEAAEIYHDEGRYDRLLATVDRLQESVGADQAPARSDLLRGIAMRELGRPSEARRCFARAAEKDPGDASPHLQLASWWLERGNVEQARASLAEAKRRDPEAGSAPGAGNALVPEEIGKAAPRLAEERPRPASAGRLQR